MACGEGPAIRGANPLWLFVDLVGNLFDDNFYMWVLENEIPYIPATVWHDAAQTLPWTNPIQFLANGTLPIDIYWDPTKYYRLEFRRNDGTLPPSQNDPLIYLVENYNPGGISNTPAQDTDTNTDNQISNPQFAVVNFNSPYTLTGVTNPPPIEIAPDWFLDLTGTGTVTINRIPLNTGVTNPTNAPYALQITLTGSWTNNAILRQRFYQNGMNWMGKNISSSITARMDGAPQNIFARLDASNGQPLAVLFNVGLTNAFTEYTNVVAVPAFVNPDFPPDAYIDYKLFLPPTGDFFVTSFQVIAQNTLVDVEYEQITVNRQIDHLFHYYKPQLEYKPIPSYLIGWDFPLNPAQLGEAIGPIATGNNGSFYAWDQTIIFQSVDNAITVARGPTGGLELTAQLATQGAVIQYLEEETAREILQGNCSVALRGFCSDAQQIATISLWATNDVNLPDLNAPNFDSIVATLNVDGSVATTNGAGWVQLSQTRAFKNKATLNNIAQEFYFSGWTDNTVTPRALNATFFAIVISFDLIAQNETVTIDWCSNNAGMIATRPAPKTFSETLLDCQRYFFKTFPPGTAPAQNSLDGYLEWQVVAAAGDSIMQLRYPVPLRAVPNVTTYNPAQANASIWNFNTTTVAASTTVPTSTVVAVTVDAGTTGGWADGNILGVHLTADARLGIVN
jgi:hypothetical protein